MSPCFYNAIHATIGAYASFTLGCKGASGGLGLELGRPADQSVFIGMESGEDGVYNALPFFAAKGKHEDSFTNDAVTLPQKGIKLEPFPDEIIVRDYRLCSDVWQAGALRFTVYSPVGPVPDLQKNPGHADLPRLLLPAVTAELQIDNSQSARNRKAFFGFTANEGAGMRHIRGVSGNICGIGQGRNLAICTDEKSAVAEIGFCAEDVLLAAREGRANGMLGNTALLLFDVPPGRKMAVRFAICFFRDGLATSGIEGSYLYNRFFASIDAVAEYALSCFSLLRDVAIAANERIDNSQLSWQRKFMLIHAIRGYYGNTQLLDTAEGILWIVNEGEYRMINTLDLLADHLFFELSMNPWTVRNVLDWYAERYSYRDSIGAPEQGSRRKQAGISFTHDMGVANVLANPGTSAYERPGRRGLFSYMTHEELVNWVLAACVYAMGTGDWPWAASRRELLFDCFESLLNRDHPDAAHRTGFMQQDSSLCLGGGEITTFDSLDPSLGQAKGNSYVAVKRWAAFVLLNRIFVTTGCGERAEKALQAAAAAADAVIAQAKSSGLIPALIDDPAAANVALPLIEGLIFPWVAGCRECFAAGSAFAPLIDALKRHFTCILESGACRSIDGGWKITSGSDITWLSKLYLCRFIATEILDINEDERFLIADEAHSRWLLDERNSYFAWSDQFENGTVVGSRYYPRGVTGILWLQEKPK